MKAGLPDTSTVRSSLQLISSGAIGAAVAATLGSDSPHQLRAPNFKRTESQFALDEHLLGLWGTDELSQRRRTAWTRLFPDTAENCAEACHLMRQILASLFDQFASTASVRKAAWWRPYVPAREGASYRDKLKYFVACSDAKGVSQPLLDELERQLDRALNAHTQTIKVAHANVRSALEIAKAAMILLEEVTFTLLRYRRSLAVCA